MIQINSRRSKMYIKLLGFLLWACQIISIESSLTNGNKISVRKKALFDTRTRSANLPKGYVAFITDHAAYKIHKEGTTWNEARERCISEGAHLAISDSVDKIMHINSLKIDWAIEWLHVGIYKSNVTNEWERIDNGLPIDSVPWKSNNPDGSGRCTAISLIEAGLVDIDCDYPGQYYVCEIPI